MSVQLEVGRVDVWKEPGCVGRQGEGLRLGVRCGHAARMQTIAIGVSSWMLSMVTVFLLIRSIQAGAVSVHKLDNACIHSHKS